jgi:hypothetical protein
MFRSLHTAACGSLCVISISVAALGAEPVDFNRDIRPILNRHCTLCHGGVKQAADISYIYREKTLESGIIIPGQPDESELIARIKSDDPEQQMPPPGERNVPLTEAEIDLLERWIREGAVWGTHWSFEIPIDPPIPSVSRTDWVCESLDAFVLQRLEAEQLAPSPEAEPDEWLRRASLDLTGLPPTVEETERFVQDCRRNEANRHAVYEAQVDRLLASQAYGERWAAMWMDLARYSDTRGFENDPHRDLWPYRDWLIRAFNCDMPFDEFTIKQLAGDLLPEPTADDLIATAFHRATQTNTEGGTDDEEFRVAAVIDRVNSTWTIWQATTFGCVQCHSHPYDPIQHTEYYAFMAFFNSTEDHDLDDDFPTMSLPTGAAEAEQAASLDRQRRILRRSLNDAGRVLASDTSQWTTLLPAKLETSHGQLRFEENGQILTAGGTFPPGCVYTVTTPAPAMTALRVAILPEADNPAAWPETGSVISKLELSLQLPDGQTKPLGIREVIADYLAGPYDPQDAIRDGVEGFGGYPKLIGPRWAVFVLEQPANPPDGATLIIKLKQDAQTTGNRAVHLRRFSLATTQVAAWTDCVSNPQRIEQFQQLQKLTETRLKLKGAALPIMQQREQAAVRPTRLFIRGNWLDRGDLADPALPAIFPPIDDPQPTRLSLARWLVSERNPLAARVLVNRLWAQLFGIGIVETQEDFCSTGAPPSHPPLLDHLAIRLQQHHAWHLKPFLKELVLSATYRQSQRTTQQLRERDPQNRLLARGPRTRLSAEMIRDQALTASGLLSRTIGGPSVMPLQPEGIWRVIYNDAKWVTSEGPDRYRRGLYTYWRRTSPYPSFLMFDTPTREFCTARRISTNTPLQALVTLNDPVYVECAAALADEAKLRAGADRDAQLSWAYRAATTHAISPAALKELVVLYDAACEQYAAAQTNAFKSAEDYALSVVANTILNLDAALNK